uniref:Methyltransf_21 domain-containing protein n=1 Tax=Panagrellus redivivus TaxID=6233 RepID=A0A7E4URQ1_PANRE
MRNCRFSYVLIGVSIATLFFLIQRNSVSQSINFVGIPTPSSPLLPWTPELEHAVTCLRTAFQDGTSFRAAYHWFYLPETTDKCSSKIATILSMQEFVGEEPKFFIPTTSRNFTYKMLTLGVGHNLEAEEKIMKAHPGCTRYVGVDPDPKINQDLVEKLGGKFLKHVVAVDDNIGVASLLGQGQAYNTVQTKRTSLINVIKEAELTDVIDVLIMDIEGAEFSIFLDMIESPQKYPVICQLNIEFHDAFANGPEALDIIDSFDKMALQSRYLLLKVTQYPCSKPVFNRSFFINIKDEYCIKKYVSKLFTSA